MVAAAELHRTSGFRVLDDQAVMVRRVSKLFVRSGCAGASTR
jgi:hypothetical protein